MIANRIEQIINTYCNGNKSTFAKQVGIAPSAISNITGIRQGSPSFEVLEKIANAFPAINCNWLLTGKGDMETKTMINTNEDIDTLKRLVKAQDEIIKLQKRINELTEEKGRSINDLTTKKKENTPIKRGQ